MYENNEYIDNNESTENYGTAPVKFSPYDVPEKKMKKESKAHPTAKRFGMMLVSGVAFGLAASLVFVGVLKASGVDKTLAALNSGVETTTATEEANVFDSEEDEIKETEIVSESAEGKSVSEKDVHEYTVADITQSCMPSIVSITNKGVEEVRSMFGTREYESTSVGSGIIIGQNEDELLIATNNHVVANSTELSVCFGDDENKVVSAKIKGTDVNNDLAIISISTKDLSDDVKSSIAVAKIGKSSEMKVGDQVVAIGNALGYGQSVTTGIVSAKDREVTIEGITAKLIQTDAAINPGNSGGALLNMKGELVGINSSKFASEMVEGMGYAIPIDTAQPILEELMLRETRDEVPEKEQGYLGISCQNVSSDISEMYGIPKGVYILETTSGGAAEKAGIQKGDILTQFDGIKISDYDELKSNLKYYKVGETVDVVVQRMKKDGGYEKVILTVTLSKNENERQGNDRSEQMKPFDNPDERDRNGGRGYSAEDLFNEFFW